MYNTPSYAQYCRVRTRLFAEIRTAKTPVPHVHYASSHLRNYLFFCAV